MRYARPGKTSWAWRMWRVCGRIVYWIGWPGVYVILRTQPPRTRVVLMFDGKILLIQNWMGAGTWTLPGGGLYQQEQAAIGASRELFEEVGLRLQPSQLVSLGSFKVRSHGIPVTIVGYTVTLSHKPRIRLRGIEVADYCWVTPQEITALHLSATASEPIAQALAHRS